MFDTVTEQPKPRRAWVFAIGGIGALACFALLVFDFGHHQTPNTPAWSSRAQNAWMMCLMAAFWAARGFAELRRRDMTTRRTSHFAALMAIWAVLALTSFAKWSTGGPAFTPLRIAWGVVALMYAGLLLGFLRRWHSATVD